MTVEICTPALIPPLLYRAFHTFPHFITNQAHFYINYMDRHLEEVHGVAKSPEFLFIFPCVSSFIVLVLKKQTDKR